MVEQIDLDCFNVEWMELHSDSQNHVPQLHVPHCHEFHLKRHQLRGKQSTTAKKKKGDMLLVTVGAEGSILKSSSVYSVANGLAQVAMDPSSPSLHRHYLITDPSSSSGSELLSFSLEDYLSHEQSRAALLVMLNKLIIASAPEVTPSLLNRIIAILNCDFGGLGIGEFQVNAVEFDILKTSAASLLGIFTLMDHQASSLSAILDIVAPLGCEATKADASALLDAIDLDHDRFSVEEEVTVVRHCKLLLNGSGHVGQTQVKSVAEIPRLHGCFRRVVTSIHSMAQVELNTSTKAGSGNAVAATVLPLIRILKIMCENGIDRSSMIVKSLESTHELRSAHDQVLTMYKSQCPKMIGLDCLYQTVSYYIFTWDTARFVKEVCNLLGRTTQIVRWEAALAFLMLKGDSNIASSDNGHGKANKVALGEGNAIILQHIRDSLQSDHINVKEGIFENLDPMDPKFDSFVGKIRETLESNER